MTSRLKKASYTIIVGLGLFAGAAGIAVAAGGGDDITPAGNENNVEADEDDGVNCEDGIDSATGAECDGGPAANPANDPNEPGEVNEAND